MGALAIFHHNMDTKRHLISVTPETAPDDGVHVEGFDLVGVLGDHVAQLVPQLVVGLPLLAAIGKHAVSPFYPLKNYLLSFLPIGQIFSLTYEKSSSTYCTYGDVLRTILGNIYLSVL
jgi:hypothetical protein